MSSEELKQRGLTKNGVIFGEYQYYNLGNTTINQLKASNIIPNLDYGVYGIRKPDGLITLNEGGGSRVIAVIEYKDSKEFQKDEQKTGAIEQCNDLAQVLNAKIGIITDSFVTYWINPTQADSRYTYKDRTTNVERSYSYILNDDKQKLQTKFNINSKNVNDINKLDDDTKEVYQIIKRVLAETDSKNSILKPSEITDPSGLARSVWQSIYISTKENPTACLYNVVEIFIFKFLSDLGVLKQGENFESVFEKCMPNSVYSAEQIIKHYALICRPSIRTLFPAGPDGTTIINGTIFVNKDGSPVLSQANLFKDTIEKYAYFGNLKNIKKEFKTKLFETFLKQSSDKNKLGQFFTPRKVVKAIVGLADVEKANFICDPFCGVGGFVLEPLQASNFLKNKFLPDSNGEIKSGIKIEGYDTGREDNDEQKRTIILAKANMLIYISDLIEKRPDLSNEFSKLINRTFRFLSQSNLGTLEIMFEEEDKPDLIITNPPYISSGVAIIRKEIEALGLSDFYLNSGKGVEGLCLKWIVNNLRKGGHAYIILPDSIFNVFANSVLRDEIKEKCFIDCIISLPKRTFFNTPAKTYILGITKKMDPSETQTSPIFTYLATTIGETLDVNRFEIEDNYLDKAKILFNQFKGLNDQDRNLFATTDIRCKIQPFSKFDEKYWIIDKWWSEEEKIKIGIEEEKEILTIGEYQDKIIELKDNLKELDIAIENTNFTATNTKMVDIYDIFHIKKGLAKFTKAYINENSGDYPVYSSQTSDLGKIGSIDTYQYDTECLTWTTDGTYVGTVFYRNERFSATTHCGLLFLKKEYKTTLDFKYLAYILNQTLPEYKLGEGSNKRIGTTRIKEIKIPIPINSSGEFDLNLQRQIAQKNKVIEEFQEKLNDEIKSLKNYNIKII